MNPKNVTGSKIHKMKMFPLLIINQHIRIISEGPCIENWSNDADNSALITEINYTLYILKYI